MGLAGPAHRCRLWICGSIATGDFVPGVSDIDLLAIVDGDLTTARRKLRRLHRSWDRRLVAGPLRGTWLGCVYVSADALPGFEAGPVPLASAEANSVRHLTWTHRKLIRRRLSLMMLTELSAHGRAVVGSAPSTVFAAASVDDVRRAALAELTGFWAWAVSRPWWWLRADHIDLATTSAARLHAALDRGELLTKSAALTAASDNVVPAQLREFCMRRRTQLPRRHETAARHARIGRATVLRLVAKAQALPLSEYPAR